MRRYALILAVLACGVISGPAVNSRSALAAPLILEDSTATESWVLSNGLKVVTRDLKGAKAVAITVCYRTGSADDPPAREGLAALLAEIAFTSPAGELPERTREEMGSLRPLGWNLKTTWRLTQLSEIAAREKFPGVLHQVALRMRGVTVTPESYHAALATVRRGLAENYSDRVDRALYYRVGELAAGHGQPAVLRYASGAGLQGVTPKEAQERLASLYVPANAILSIAGDLSGVDLHRLLDGEFASIPAGTRLPDAHPAPRRAGTHVMPVSGLTASAGTIGIIAPALTDSLHPSFYLNMLILGSAITTLWGSPSAPLGSRFQFSILDDPDLARFYPSLSDSTSDSLAVARELHQVFKDVPRLTLDQEAYDRIRRGVGWLLGGPLSPELIQRAKNDPALIYNLSSSMATREMWGGQAFWSAYRRHFEEDPDPGWQAWERYVLSRRNQVLLLLTPAPRQR